ncbi:MAG: sensor histidine kinase [Acidobacteria bacterium]|nr:sensor histidine kinase [Acidobacteriota bacterium]
MKEPSTPANSLLELVTEPAMSRVRVLRFAAAGFVLVVGLVLLAAYLGYQGSNRIQNTAQEMVRYHLVELARGAEIEKSIIAETQNLIDRLIWVLGLCFVLAAGTAALTFWIIQRAFARLEWQSAELARVSWHLLDGHERMARRFSHEMHDELGQALSGLRRMLTRENAADFESLRKECVEVVDEVIEDVRKLSQALRPVILDDLGLDSGLRWLTERFSQRTQIPVTYQSNLTVRLDGGTETHLFRIAQEALTNIARHADASEASVTLQQAENMIRLEIADNGCGLMPHPGAGPSLGTVGMRARARQLGGELIMQNRREGGLLIHAEVPLRRRNPNAEQEDSSFVG